VKLRDIRNPGWFWAQNELFDVFLPLIGANGVVVYMAMCRLLPHRPDGRLSLREIADNSGVSKSAVGRSRADLVALGMIAEKATGTTSRSTFELLDLRAAAEVGPEELQRRLTLSQTRELPSETVPELKVGTVRTVPHRDSLERKSQHLRGSPQKPTVPPRDSLTGPETVLSQSYGTVASSQSELFKDETKTRERENARDARESKPLDLIGLAGMIVLAHPRAKMRNWTEHDVLYADRMAAIEAARHEADLVAGTPEDAALMILGKIERIAREVPRDQWRFLKEIDKFLRLREYRMEPKDLYRPQQGGSHVRTQTHQPQSSGAQRSAPAQRGTNTRANIRSALERRLRRGAGDVDGRDPGEISEPGAAGGDAGHVPGGMGADGGPLRAA